MNIPGRTFLTDEDLRRKHADVVAEIDRDRLLAALTNHQQTLDRYLGMRKLGGGFGDEHGGTIDTYIERERQEIVHLNREIEKREKIHEYEKLARGSRSRYYALKLAGMVLSRIPNFDTHLGNIERAIRAKRLRNP